MKYRKLIEEESALFINVTPLVDTMMVLLVMFMIISPIIIKGTLQVALPKAKTAKKEIAPKITITITKDKKIFLMNKEISLSQLKTQLKSLLTKIPRSQRIVIIKADKRIRLELFVKVADIAQELGAKVKLMAELKSYERS